MKLHHLALYRDASADPLHFPFQDGEVGRRHALILLNDYAAGAEQAQTLAKWNVHVQRYGAPRAFGLLMHTFQIIRAEGIIPHRRGRIAGVARSGPVVARQEFLADAQLLANLLQSWIRQFHRSASTFNAKARQRAPRSQIAPAGLSR